MLASWLMKMRLGKLKGLTSFDDSFYEETTDQEWKVLRSHTTTKQVNKKTSRLTTEDMLFMQTNVLSAIPECFDLEAPRVLMKPRDGAKESRPPKTSDFVKRKSPIEPYVRNGVKNTTGGYLLRDERRKPKEKQEQELRKRKSGCVCDKDENRTSPTSFESRDTLSDDVKHNEPSNESESSYTYQNMFSEFKLKTKTKVRKKRSSSAPPLRRSASADEVTSCTEYRHVETSISFASYVKRRTPTFSLNKTKTKPKLKKLRRTEAMNNISLCGFSGLDGEDLHVANDNNVTFNPIFQDDEHDENRCENMNHEVTERDSHVQVKNDEPNNQQNDDVSRNHVERPPLVRSDHVEELEATNSFDDIDEFGVNDHVDEDKPNHSSHEAIREPIITFDTTYIRRDLYIIDEEPENE